jgi:hypothetical protein
MAGRLTISTLNNDTGVLATQNGMSGIAKAWVNYNGSTQTVRDSFNISSVTYNTTGDYTLNFTTAMPNANYSVAGIVGDFGTNNSSRNIAVSSGTAPTTSAIRIIAMTAAGTAENPVRFLVSVFSS